MLSQSVRVFSKKLAILLALLCTALIAIFSAVPSPIANGAEEESATHPPALIILTDGVRWDDISVTETPNLANWAAAGAMFNVVPPSFSGIYCPIDVALAYGAGKELAAESIAPLADCTVPKIQPRVGDTDWDYWFYRIQNFRNPPEHPNDTLGFFSGALTHNQIESATIGDAAAAMMLSYGGNMPKNHTGASTDNKFFTKQVTDSLRLNQLTIVGASTTDFTASTKREILTNQILDPNFKTELTKDEVSALTDEFALAQGKANAQRIDQLLASVEPGTLVMFTSLMNLGDDGSLQPGFISTGPANAGGSSNVDTSENAAKSENKFALNSVAIPGATMLDAKVQQPGTVLYSSLLPTFFKLLGIDTAQYAEEYAQERALANSQLPSAQSAAETENSLNKINSDTDSSALENNNEETANVESGNLLENISAESVIASELKKLDVNTESLQFSGKNPHSCSASNHCFLQRRADLSDAALRSHAINEVRNGFFKSIRLSTIGFLLFASVLAIFTRFSKRVFQYQQISAAFIAFWSILGLTISAVLVSSHILSLFVHWWRAENPALVMLGGSWIIALGLSCIAYFGFHRFGAYTPALIIFGLTSVLLLIEIATGSKHLIDAPIGFNTLTGARFYGLGNEGFAILASCWLIVLGFIPSILVLVSRKFTSNLTTDILRRIYLTLVGIIGLITLAIIAAPKMGADFGGAISFSAALMLLLFLIADVRISWKKTLLLGLAGGFAAMGVAVFDWLRGPKSRTHLGNFVQALLDGDAGEIVMRKISVNLRLLTTSSHRFVVLAALIAIAVVILPWLYRAKKSQIAAFTLLARNNFDSATAAKTNQERAKYQTAEHGLKKYYADEIHFASTMDLQSTRLRLNLVFSSMTNLQYGLIAVGVCLLIAFAVNDSGIVLPGMGSIAVLPALLPAIQFTHSYNELRA